MSNSSEHARPPSTAQPADRKADGDLYTANQWQLMWRKFRRHRLAVGCAIVLLALYVIAAFCEIIAPYGLENRNVDYVYAPPQPLRFVSDEGWHLRPFVYALQGQRDAQTRRPVYEENHQRKLDVRFFVRSDTYRLWGLFETDVHLFGVEEGTIFLLGTDSLGRDLLSRVIYGARISLTIGLIGVAGSFLLGLTLGTISGYYGGWVDLMMQRGIEILQCFPTIPLWMALAAALPRDWGPIQVYAGITVIISLVGWTTLGREVRGKILSLREEDYALAAELTGARQSRIMFRHLLPAFMSHIIVALTIQVPQMILAETALSFLGLGLRPPVTSWGVMLQEAQNVEALTFHPWLLAPVFAVIGTVLAFNFVGDGLRDAADPYAN